MNLLRFKHVLSLRYDYQKKKNSCWNKWRKNKINVSIINISKNISKINIIIKKSMSAETRQ